MLTTEMQKSGRVQSRNTLQKPLFDRLFCVLALFSSIDLVQNSAVKKKDRHHPTDKSGPISMLDVIMLWTAKCQIPLVEPLKSSSENE